MGRKARAVIREEAVIQRLDREVRRQLVLERSLELFLSQGYELTSSREIAEASGMSKANVYHHFGSKDDLLRELLSPLFEDARKLVNRFSTGDRIVQSPPAALEECLALMLEHRKTIILIITNISIYNKADIKRQVDETRRCVREMLVGSRPSAEAATRTDCALNTLLSTVLVDGHEEKLIRTVTLEAALRTLGEPHSS